MDELVAVLTEARALGFLGTGSLDEQLAISLRFAEHLPRTGSILDLGSGGGIPAFGAARVLPDTRWTLVERSQTRADYLARWARRLGVDDRVAVECDDAVLCAHHPDHRGRYDSVTARGFAAPEVTAEVAVGFLRVGGHLVVSQSDTTKPEWDSVVSMGNLGLVSLVDSGSIRVLELVTPADQGIPRRRLSRRGA